MNKSKYDALDIANYIVNYSIECDCPVSNLKLQKLLYYVQAASLVKTGSSIFNDNISAWRYGPVVESVYHNFKVYVNKPIDERIITKFVFFDFMATKEYDPKKIIKKNDRMLIENIVDSYRDKSAMYMVRKTHSEDPWKNAFRAGEDYIKTEDMRKYYSTEMGERLIYGD